MSLAVKSKELRAGVKGSYVMFDKVMPNSDVICGLTLLPRAGMDDLHYYNKRMSNAKTPCVCQTVRSGNLVSSGSQLASHSVVPCLLHLLIALHDRQPPSINPGLVGQAIPPLADCRERGNTRIASLSQLSCQCQSSHVRRLVHPLHELSLLPQW
jgi:hypothetical protein